MFQKKISLGNDDEKIVGIKIERMAFCVGESFESNEVFALHFWRLESLEFVPHQSLDFNYIYCPSGNLKRMNVSVPGT